MLLVFISIQDIAPRIGTKERRKEGRALRQYRQYCGVAKALDVLGERWTLLLIRELLLGQRRFSELLRGLPGITPNLLTQRLAHLRSHGVIEQLPSPDRRGGPWGLTDLGRSLEGVVLGLGAFGARWMTEMEGHHTSGRWFMVSLRRRYRGGGPGATLGVEIDGEPYTIRVTPERLETADGWPEAPDATLAGTLNAVASCLLGGASGGVIVSGDKRTLRALTSRLGQGPGDAAGTSAEVV